MISQTLEYALRAVVAIAQQDGQPCTARRIAELTEIPLPYLSKLMQGLVRAEIVRSQRGLHGGFILTRPAAEISLFEVVQVVDPIRRIEHCPLRIREHGTTLCPLHRRIDDALAATEKLFRETTIAEMLAGAGGITPLCEAPVSQRQVAPTRGPLPPAGRDDPE